MNSKEMQAWKSTLCMLFNHYKETIQLIIILPLPVCNALIRYNLRRYEHVFNF
jgi:hypothetical protein